MENKILLKTPKSKDWLTDLPGVLGNEITDILRKFCEGRLFIGHLTNVEIPIVLSSGLWKGINDRESYVLLEIIEKEGQIEIVEDNHKLQLRIPTKRISEFLSLMADEWGKSIGRIQVKDIGKLTGAANLFSPRIVIRGQFSLAEYMRNIDKINWIEKDLDLLDWIKDYDELSMDNRQKRAYELIMREAYSLAEDFHPIIIPLKVIGTATLVFHCAFVQNPRDIERNLRHLKSNEIQIVASSLQQAFKNIYNIEFKVKIIQHDKKLPQSKERVIRVGCHMFTANAGWRNRLGPDTVIGITGCVDNEWVHHIESEIILDRASISR